MASLFLCIICFLLSLSHLLSVFLALHKKGEKGLPVVKVGTYIKAEDGTKFRDLVCTSPNTWSYPAKDRSGRLDMIEEPHLGKLFAKIKSGQRKDALVTQLPETTAA